MYWFKEIRIMKHIVVVGGGIAGKKVISDLIKIQDIHVTLVDPQRVL